MAWVYIVECADGFYYTGSTVNLERRLWEHNEGSGANFTKKRLPVKLVFAEESDSVETAFIREKQIQGWSRAKKRALIERRWADLPELAKRGPTEAGPASEVTGR
jgi:putative endonuclease